jgi:hypothetical protein
MRLNPQEHIDKLVEGYRAALEDDGGFIASEMNSNAGMNLFDYDPDTDEIVIADGVDQLPHIRVEYDTNYFGGDYNGIGKFEFIPEGLSPFVFDTVKEAFEAYTGIPRQHVIHYSSDETFFPDGSEWIDPA